LRRRRIAKKKRKGKAPQYIFMLCGELYYTLKINKGGEEEMEVVELVDEFPLYTRKDEKEKFLLVLGLLLSRTISFGRAAELVEITEDGLWALLDALGIEFSMLDEEEARREREMSERLLK
jgi:predicted HTH domain antitoxin